MTKLNEENKFSQRIDSLMGRRLKNKFFTIEINVERGEREIFFPDEHVTAASLRLSC